jgi:hypothetical protein
MSTTFDEVFSELCGRYHVESTLDKMVARAATTLLVAEMTPAAAAQADGLLSRLREREGVDGDGAFDVNKLTEWQWRAFQKLQAIGCGRIPATPEHRRKSTEYWDAVEASRIVDVVRERGGGMQNIQPNELIRLRGLITMMLSPLRTTPREFWSAHFAETAPAEPAPPSVDEAEMTRLIERAKAAAVKADNVIPINDPHGFGAIARANSRG